MWTGAGFPTGHAEVRAISEASFTVRSQSMKITARACATYQISVFQRMTSARHRSTQSGHDMLCN